MGRYIGLFASPFEGGITYSLGILGWLWAANISNNKSFFNQILLVLMFIGGILAVSKAFLVGIFIFILYLLTDVKRAKIIINWRLILSVPLVSFFCFTVMKEWNGIAYLLQLFLFEDRNLEALIMFFSAGRYGASDTDVWIRTQLVLRLAPFSGFGL